MFDRGLISVNDDYSLLIADSGVPDIITKAHQSGAAPACPSTRRRAAAFAVSPQTCIQGVMGGNYFR
ncbi:hypothetical protein [Neorhizobium sp. T25_27]|uniref:hypothetical protein n=1 Tax=Neorhizobium sp. T25_27 TaxID=2093831 RepID=UPI001FE074B7|nr:hypothetical protein [Neorhizobium sp. T25_27]